jgi:hypothetical protein
MTTLRKHRVAAVPMMSAISALEQWMSGEMAPYPNGY